MGLCELTMDLLQNILSSYGSFLVSDLDILGRASLGPDVYYLSSARLAGSVTFHCQKHIYLH